MPNKKSPSIGVAVITHNAKHHLPYCLPHLLNSSLNPKVLVVNSSSQDGTVEEAERLGAETLVVPRHTFNHGSTREIARRHLATDIVVMMTPDAYPLDNRLLETLVAPILANTASIAYAKQLPHQGAGFFESFSRSFNYPEQPQLRSLEDKEHYGVYTFFCSNSCCAWKNAALDEIGGFANVLIGEDTVAASKLLRKGHRIAYVAEACVRHSHAYTLWQEFQRHYDTGLARKHYQALLQDAGSDAQRGKAYVRALFKQLSKQNKTLIPYAALQTLVKWLGYQFGRRTTWTPKAFKSLFSGQDFYWKKF
jgi:rhamnosyltransferase